MEIVKNHNKQVTAGVHRMRPFCRHSFIIIVIVVVVSHSKSFQPRKPRFLSFENNTGPSDGRTDGRTRPLIEMRGRI